MGSQFDLSGTPSLHVEAIGTDTIRTVELIRDGYTTLLETHPDTPVAAVDYSDRNVSPGRTHSYYVRVIQADQHYAWSSPVWVTVSLERGDPLVVDRPFPNPFNGSVTVTFTVAAPARVTATVWSVDGRRIRTLVSRRRYDAGSHDLAWDGRNDAGTVVASGVYFLHVSAPAAARTRRIVFLK